MSTVVKLKNAAAKELRQAALAFPDTVEDFPWGHNAFKVSGKKAFLFMGEDEEGGWSCSMKLPFRNDEALTIKGAERTGYGLGKSGWVSFRFTAKARRPWPSLSIMSTRAGAPWRRRNSRLLSRRPRFPSAAKRPDRLPAGGISG